MQFYRIDGLIQERKKPSETGGLQTARERQTNSTRNLRKKHFSS